MQKSRSSYRFNDSVQLINKRRPLTRIKWFPDRHSSRTALTDSVNAKALLGFQLLGLVLLAGRLVIFCRWRDKQITRLRGLKS